MELFIILGITLGIVALAEIGDKTQLMTISLASKYDEKSVFFGIFLGMAIITVIGVIIGTVLYRYLPVFHIKILAALIFILFGIYSFYKEETHKEKNIDNRKAFTTSFFLSMLAEFGDKTQLVIIALTARFQNPLIVLIGALTGLGVVVSLGVFLGSKISDLVDRERIELISAILFIVLGFAFLLEPLLLG